MTEGENTIARVGELVLLTDPVIDLLTDPPIDLLTGGRPASVLDPDRPGPTDLLSKAQYQKYRAVYDAHNGEPGEKHAAAWRAALTDGEHGPQADPIARPRPDGEVPS